MLNIKNYQMNKVHKLSGKLISTYEHNDVDKFIKMLIKVKPTNRYATSIVNFVMYYINKHNDNEYHNNFFNQLIYSDSLNELWIFMFSLYEQEKNGSFLKYAYGLKTIDSLHVSKCLELSFELGKLFEKYDVDLLKLFEERCSIEDYNRIVLYFCGWYTSYEMCPIEKYISYIYEKYNEGYIKFELLYHRNRNQLLEKLKSCVYIKPNETMYTILSLLYTISSKYDLLIDDVLNIMEIYKLLTKYTKIPNEQIDIILDKSKNISGSDEQDIILERLQNELLQYKILF